MPSLSFDRSFINPMISLCWVRYLPTTWQLTPFWIAPTKSCMSNPTKVCRLKRVDSGQSLSSSHVVSGPISYCVAKSRPLSRDRAWNCGRVKSQPLVLEDPTHAASMFRSGFYMFRLSVRQNGQNQALGGLEQTFRRGLALPSLLECVLSIPLALQAVIIGREKKADSN